MPELPLPVPYRLFRHFYCVPRALSIHCDPGLVSGSLNLNPNPIRHFLPDLKLDPRLRGDDDAF